MIRFGVALFVLAGSAMMAQRAYGQVVQYQFTPPPPIVPAGSSPTPGYYQVPGVAPPVPAPERSAGPYPFTPSWTVKRTHLHSPRFVQAPGRAPVVVAPLGSGPHTSSDRVTHCLHAGTAAGLGANELGTFTNLCLN
jgi:hypothetical protein